MTITAANIEAGYEDARWLGHGYLGERAHADEARLLVADRVLLDAAEIYGWDEDAFFYFLNSKAGRWYGDIAFGSYLPLADYALFEQADDAGLFFV
jgi:hypothetical protein